MNQKKIVVFEYLMTIVLISPSIFGAGGGSASRVNVSPNVQRVEILSEQEFQLEILLKIEDGWHIYAQDPLSSFFIGTRMDLSPLNGLQLVSLEYPEAKKVKFDFSTSLLAVYEGASVVKVIFKPTSDLPVGEHVLTGNLRVQACNDQICLAPATIVFQIPFEIVKNGGAMRSAVEVR
jgi:DsbC/DsbD-like thiol-disulfide interchange protein